MGRNKISIERIKNDKIRNVITKKKSHLHFLLLLLIFFSSSSSLVNLHETKGWVGQEGHGAFYPVRLRDRPNRHQPHKQVEPLL